MADKHIKDGIDVSKCECYSIKDNSCSDTLSGSCMKEKCQTFRLLQTIKAKEQECEELKKDCTLMKQSRDLALKNYDEEFEYKRKITVEHLEQKKELLKQLEQLKAENKELKLQLTSLSYADTICALEIDLKHKTQECEQVEQKLKKIKPILEYYANSNIGEKQFNGTYRYDLDNENCILYDPRKAKEGLKIIDEV